MRRFLTVLLAGSIFLLSIQYLVGYDCSQTCKTLKNPRGFGDRLSDGKTIDCTFTEDPSCLGCTGAGATGWCVNPTDATGPKKLTYCTTMGTTLEISTLSNNTLQCTNSAQKVAATIQQECITSATLNPNSSTDRMVCVKPTSS